MKMLLNFLNGIIHLICLALSIFIFRDIFKVIIIIPFLKVIKKNLKLKALNLNNVCTNV